MYDHKFIGIDSDRTIITLNSIIKISNLFNNLLLNFFTVLLLHVVIFFATQKCIFEGCFSDHYKIATHYIWAVLSDSWIPWNFWRTQETNYVFSIDCAVTFLKFPSIYVHFYNFWFLRIVAKCHRGWQLHQKFRSRQESCHWAKRSSYKTAVSDRLFLRFFWIPSGPS